MTTQTKPKSKPAKKKFTKQVETFIDEMSNPKTKSATAAAVKAGSPPASARVTASRWLTNANISGEIQARINRTLAHTQVTKEEVLGSAVFNMRSSIDDMLDEHGSFSIDKARATGAIHLIKKHREIITTNEKGETKRMVEVELESPAAARREVANYIGLEKAPVPVYSLKDATHEELAAEFFVRLLIIRRMYDEEIIELSLKQYPNDRTDALRADFHQIFAEAKKDENTGLELIRQKFPKIDLARHLASRAQLEAIIQS